MDAIVHQLEAELFDQFFSLNLLGIAIVCRKFQLYGVAYIAIFSLADSESMTGMPERVIRQYSRQNGTAVKFAVFEHFKNTLIDSSLMDNLYHPPSLFVFSKQKRMELMDGLAQLMQRHYDIYRPDFYFFVADEEKPGLIRLYGQICRKYRVYFEQVGGYFVVRLKS